MRPGRLRRERRRSARRRKRNGYRAGGVSWQDAVVDARDVRLVTDRELALLSSEVRQSASRVDELLDPDFREIGASGRLWTRAEIVAALARELPDAEGSIEVTEMTGEVIGPDLVLLTYVSGQRGKTARRSSL